MKRFNYLFFIACLMVISGCHHQEPMKQLEMIDQLLTEQKNDSAYHLLNSIAIESVDDPAYQAYYTLLKTQAEYRLNRTIHTTDMLDRSIAYYEKKHDTDKLIKCYYYKGSLSDDFGNAPDAIAYLNKAEILLKDADDSDHYKLSVYEAIANVNEKIKHYPLAVNYLLKAVKCAVKQQDSVALAYDYMNLGAFYYEMGKGDSASYFRKKIIPLLKFIPEERRSSFYVNIGGYYDNLNTDSAKAYYQRAITLGSYHAYNHMAQLYSKEGKHELALQNWKKAFESKEKDLKIDVLKRMSNEYEKMYKYEEMSKIQNSLIALKDSFSKKQLREDVRGKQERYQMEQHHREKEKSIYRIVVGLLLLLVCSLIVIFFLKRRHSIQQAQLNEDQLLLSQYLERLKVLEENAEKNKREILLLNNKILELENKRGAMLATGRNLYEDIKNGATNWNWNGNDYTCFMAYYKVLDYEFVTHLENDYYNLKPRYMFLETLYHMQLPTGEIARIMGVEERTIDSYMSRNRKHRKKNTTND